MTAKIKLVFECIKERLQLQRVGIKEYERIVTDGIAYWSDRITLLAEQELKASFVWDVFKPNYNIWQLHHWASLEGTVINITDGPVINKQFHFDILN